MSGVQLWGIGQATLGLIALTAAVFASEWGIAALAVLGIAIALVLVFRGQGDEE